MILVVSKLLSNILDLITLNDFIYGFKYGFISSWDLVNNRLIVSLASNNLEKKYSFENLFLFNSSSNGFPILGQINYKVSNILVPSFLFFLFCV